MGERDRDRMDEGVGDRDRLPAWSLDPLLGLESDGGGLEGSAVGGVAGVLLESQEGRGGGGPFSRGAFPLWSDEGLITF